MQLELFQGDHLPLLRAHAALDMGDFRRAHEALASVGVGPEAARTVERLAALEALVHSRESAPPISPPGPRPLRRGVRESRAHSAGSPRIHGRTVRLVPSVRGAHGGGPGSDTGTVLSRLARAPLRAGSAKAPRRACSGRAPDLDSADRAGCCRPGCSNRPGSSSRPGIFGRLGLSRTFSRLGSSRRMGVAGGGACRPRRRRCRAVALLDARGLSRVRGPASAGSAAARADGAERAQCSGVVASAAPERARRPLDRCVRAGPEGAGERMGPLPGRARRHLPVGRPALSRGCASRPL